MPTDGADHNKSDNVLLATDEPLPFIVLNAESESPVILVCDHASRRFPVSLGDMGLDPPARRCHLAYDIGAGALTRELANRLSMTAVLCRYSRLVVDCNRQLLDPTAFLEFGDGVVVPGNRNLRPEQKTARAEAVYWPYHYVVEEEIKRLESLGTPPAVLAMHSFTPVLNGVSRPWHIGILSDTDRRLAGVFLEALKEAGFLVGDNEPYSGKAPQDFTIDYHAEANGLPHAGIEIRQDLIDDAAGVAEIADLFVGIIRTIPAKISEPRRIFA
ncbi:MAG: N-formylglutamate amidohydrolase [Woeseia sp.]